VTSLLVALAATGLSMGVMWVVCLRPMRRHHARRVPADPAREQLAALRREVADLRRRTEAT
jgi:hypothetical protein